MKHLKLLLLSLVLLPACRKSFPDALAQAETSFTEKNYINTIDTLNNGLLAWKESDGNEKKGRAYELLGKSYHELRNNDKADEAFEEAVKLSNNVFDAANSLGSHYLVKNQPDLAEKSFQDALRMKPDDPSALQGLGTSYYLQHKNKDAIAAFEKVLAVSPGVKESIESLAVLKKGHAAPAKAKAKTAKPAPAKKPAPKKAVLHRKKR